MTRTSNGGERPVRFLGPMTAGARHAVVVLFLLAVLFSALSLFAAYRHDALEQHAQLAHERLDEDRWCAYLHDSAAVTGLRHDSLTLEKQFGCPQPKL